MKLNATALTCTSVTPLSEQRAMICALSATGGMAARPDILTIRGITGLLVACGGRSWG